MAVQVRRRKEGVRTMPDVLGARVRARRGDLGLNQGELAHLMREQFGHRWSPGTVSRLEAGQVEPTLSELVSLTLCLYVTFDELTDPVVAGGKPVDIGLGIEMEAEEARKFLRRDQHGVLRIWQAAIPPEGRS
jgi:transcriptional regulator with XRE-family HTH domain